MTRLWLGLAFWMSTGCYQTEQAPPPIDEPPACNDADGDGWGDGDGCRGNDCDDGNAGVWNDCGDDCAANPQGPGCPCNGAETPEVCYAGFEGTLGVGQCQAGLKLCRGGAWTGCEGQVLPAGEVCDHVDNDCNGAADEGVQSVCGNCDPGCQAQCAGVGCDAVFDPSGGAEIAADGAVVVGEQADLQPYEIWIANSQAGTVVRVDTQAISLLGSYKTGPGGDNPLSVAMDGEGNAYVVNSRQGQGASTLTKIYGSGCPDVDGDGVVETSRDDDPLDWEDEECVAWNVPLEDCDNGWGCGYAWGIALTDGGRSAWISLYQGGKIVEVETDGGALTGREVDVSAPSGLVADADGNVWVAGSDRSVKRFSTADADLESFSLSAQAWATNVDVGLDGRVYLAAPLTVYDVERDEDDSTGWQAFDVAVDDAGMIWGTDGQNFRRYDAALEDYDSFSVSGTPYQIAVDRDGQVWGSEQWGTDIVVLDGDGEQVTSEIEGCGAGCLNAPNLEGDPTGVRFRRAFGGGLSEAWATHAFESNCDILEWSRVSWETQGGAVDLFARTDGGPWVALGSSPPDAGGADYPDVGQGSVLEVRAVLRGANARLVRATAQWSCGDLTE